jgi:site-specific DNA-cytosine methylase
MKDVLIIHENHSSFDCDILQRVSGKYYNIESIILNATDRGVPQSRERRWTLMSNKEYVTQTFSTLCRVMPFYTYDVKYSWHCCMVAGNDELQTELEWACNPKRASSLWPSGKKVQL